MQLFSLREKAFQTVGAETSVTGVRHAVESSSGVARVIWSTSVIVCLALTALEVGKFFLAYFHYPTVHMMRQVSRRSEMQWVIVCNDARGLPAVRDAMGDRL